MERVPKNLETTGNKMLAGALAIFVVAGMEAVHLAEEVAEEMAIPTGHVAGDTPPGHDKNLEAWRASEKEHPRVSPR